MEILTLTANENGIGCVNVNDESGHDDCLGLANHDEYLDLANHDDDRETSCGGHGHVNGCDGVNAIECDGVNGIEYGDVNGIESDGVLKYKI